MTTMPLFSEPLQLPCDAAETPRTRMRDLGIPDPRASSPSPRHGSITLVTGLVIGLVLTSLLTWALLPTSDPGATLVNPNASTQEREYALYALDHERGLQGKALQIAATDDNAGLAIASLNVWVHDSENLIQHLLNTKDQSGEVGRRARTLLFHINQISHTDD